MTLSDGVIIAIVVGLPVLGFLTGAWVMWWYVKDVLETMRQQIKSLNTSFTNLSKSLSDAADRVYEHAVGERPDDVPGSRRAQPQAGPLALPGRSYPGVTEVVFEDEVMTGELVDTGEQPLLDVPSETRVVEVRQGTFTPAVPSLSEPLIEFVENVDSHVVHHPDCGLIPKSPLSKGKFLHMWEMTVGELNEMLKEPTSKMRACKQCRPDRVRETV